MAMVLFYHDFYVFDIQNWQEIAALLLKILKIILKPHFFEKNHLVATIHWHKWKDMPLPSVCAENIFRG